MKRTIPHLVRYCVELKSEKQLKRAVHRFIMGGIRSHLYTLAVVRIVKNGACRHAPGFHQKDLFYTAFNIISSLCATGSGHGAFHQSRESRHAQAVNNSNRPKFHSGPKASPDNSLLSPAGSDGLRGRNFGVSSRS